MAENGSHKMREILILEPIHNTSADLLRCFANGKPLTPEQINFLDWHSTELSNPKLDPVLKYYLETLRKKREQRFKTSFLVPHEQINKEDIQKLKKRLQIFLKEKNSHVVIPVTPKQLEDFQAIASEELIYYHGNQYLTGAPFFAGGIAPMIYFQWGNFFGVVKYCVLPEEKSLKANIMIYFEDMQDRDMNQFVKDYAYHLQRDVQLQHEMLAIQHPQIDTAQIEKPEPILTPTPKLALGAHFLIRPYLSHQ